MKEELITKAYEVAKERYAALGRPDCFYWIKNRVNMNVSNFP